MRYKAMRGMSEGDWLRLKDRLARGGKVWLVRVWRRTGADYIRLKDILAEEGKGWWTGKRNSAEELDTSGLQKGKVIESGENNKWRVGVKKRLDRK